jgi:hypothetical protein
MRRQRSGPWTWLRGKRSVSYKTPISATQLREAFNSGTPAPEFFPHAYTLLDEAPVSLLASVVEQLHQEEGVERAQVWKRMRELAYRLKISREIWR